VWFWLSLWCWPFIAQFSGTFDNTQGFVKRAAEFFVHSSRILSLIKGDMIGFL